ncbi:MAG: prepilin peptidase [Clostridium sp.]
MVQNIYVASDIIIFFLGLIFGSFFNVCICRIPKEENIAKGRSHCVTCNRNLKFYELVPVFSWIFLKGKCVGCREKISIQYPLIEILTGISYLSVFLRYGFILDTIKYMFLISIIIVSATIDFKTKEVYLNISLVGIVGGIIFSCISIYQGQSIAMVVISVLIPVLLVGLIYILSKKFDGFGLGDLEMFIVTALYLTPREILVSIFLSILFGGVFSIGYMIMGNREKRIAFVPFIGLGTFISLMYGDTLLKMYLSLF